MLTVSACWRSSGAIWKSALTNNKFELRCCRPTNHWSQRRLALVIPLRGSRHRSGVAQFVVRLLYNFMRKFIPIVLVTATLLVGCHSPSAPHTQTVTPTVAAAAFHPIFVTAFGTTTASSDGTWRVVVSATGDAVDLSYRESESPFQVCSTISVPGPTADSPSWRGHAGWFVYVESKSRVWVYDGDGYVCLNVETAGHGSFYPTPQGFPCAVPAEVYSRLPASVQKKILIHG